MPGELPDFVSASGETDSAVAGMSFLPFDIPPNAGIPFEFLRVSALSHSV